MNYEIFKVLSDKNRCNILEIIKKNKEICACKLLENLEIHEKSSCDCGGNC